MMSNVNNYCVLGQNGKEYHSNDETIPKNDSNQRPSLSASYSAKRKSIIGSKDLRFCDDTVEQTIQLSQDFRHEKCTGDNLCLQIRNNLNYFLKMSTEECMDDNLNYGMTCYGLLRFTKRISIEIQKHSCQINQLSSTLSRNNNDICPELKFLAELIHFVHYHKCNRQRQRRGRRRRPHINIYSTMLNQSSEIDDDNNKQKKLLIQQKNKVTCLALSKDLIELFRHYIDENCAEYSSSKTNECIEIRKRLLTFLLFATTECIEWEIGINDYFFDCPELKPNLEEFSKEIQRNSCSPSNLFSPSTSTTYMRNICEELTFFYTLLDYKYFHDCIKKWRKDLFID